MNTSAANLTDSSVICTEMYGLWKWENCYASGKSFAITAEATKSMQGCQNTKQVYFQKLTHLIGVHFISML